MVRELLATVGGWEGEGSKGATEQGREFTHYSPVYHLKSVNEKVRS